MKTPLVLTHHPESVSQWLSRGTDWQPYHGTGPADADRGLYETFPTFCRRIRGIPMSAAEPADHTPPTLNSIPGAAVIDITKRAASRAGATARRRWTGMTNPAGRTPDPEPGPDRSMEQQFADDIEAHFNAVDCTLTDAGTVLIFVQTLTVVGRVLDGAQAQGIISEQERLHLADLMDALKTVPEQIQH